MRFDCLQGRQVSLAIFEFQPAWSCTSASSLLLCSRSPSALRYLLLFSCLMTGWSAHRASARSVSGEHVVRGASQPFGLLDYCRHGGQRRPAGGPGSRSHPGSRSQVVQELAARWPGSRFQDAHGGQLSPPGPVRQLPVRSSGGACRVSRAFRTSPVFRIPAVLSSLSAWL